MSEPISLGEWLARNRRPTKPFGRIFGKRALKQASKDGNNRKSLGFVKKPKFDSTIWTITTKLTDLNCDCLFSIFKFLPVNDVINMAKFNSRFVEPANMVLKKIDWTLPLEHFQFMFNDVDAYEYIGSSILKLYVDFGPRQIRHLVAEENILDYCTELKELELRNFPDGAFESIKEPFEKLEILTVSGGVMGPNFCKFKKWFPKLRSLSVNCKLIEGSCISNGMAKTIPSLEFLHLSLSKTWTIEKHPAAVYKFDDVIKSNRQLKSICLDFGKKNKFFYVKCR